MKQRLGVRLHMVKYNPFQPKLHQKQQAQLLPQPHQPGQHPQPQQQAKHMVSCVIFKGQLISKCPYEKSVLSKIPTKKISEISALASKSKK